MPIDETGFRRKRFPELVSDMEGKSREAFGEDINTSETTLLGIMLRLMSWIIADIWQDVEDVYHSSDMHTAEGYRLIRLAANKGVIPIEEQYATGTLRILGVPGYTEPAGFLIKTGEGVLFETTQSVTLNSNGSGDVSIEAMEPGDSGNVEPETITIVVNPNANVTMVTNLVATSGGRDQETQTEFRERYFEEVRDPSSSANPSQYKKWAKEIPGVYDARVFRAAGGGGNVLVVILNADNRAPSAAVVRAVNDYIQSVKPVDAVVTVRSVTEVLINITATLTLKESSDLSSVTEQCQTAVSNYLSSITDTIVRFNRISEALLSVEDVLDHDGLQINGGKGNLQLAEDEVPIAGAINFI
ncbi:baseplate J/gp47 family protein [Paenibacillus sp. Marseille-Q4541]|uniref:baseplate J/gp47 family protein n=1 Tax=Paenibacillus sp. Marseille-Q4541 TaxID=2831522 RepID=UPI001BAAB884|nr:baseplate J/gp47 family protein [Paenibacillus sp. Marseille-Q4541]